MNVIVSAKAPEIQISSECKQKLELFSGLSVKKGKDFYLSGYTLFDAANPDIIYICDVCIIPQKVTFGKPIVSKEIYQEYFGHLDSVDEMMMCSNVFCYCNSTKSFVSKNFSEYERKNILNDTNAKKTSISQYFISIYCSGDGTVKYNCYDLFSDIIYEDCDVDLCLEGYYSEEEIENEYKDNITEGYTPTYNSNTNYCGNTVNTSCKTYNYNNIKTVKKDRVKSELVKKSPSITDLV